MLSNISTYDLVIFLGVGLLLCSLFMHLQQWQSKVYLLPPGPRGLPIFGNAFQMPTKQQWMKFAQWGKEYGEILHVSAFSQHFVILNSIKSVNDLLEQRSAIYSERPTLYMAGELVGYKDSVPLCHYGSQHREYRKLMHDSLAEHKVQSFHSIQIEKSIEYLQLLHSSPDQFLRHIRHAVASVIYQISHGYTVSGIDEPLVTLAEQAILEFGLAVAPGKFLVDTLPILQYVPEWVPGAGFKKTARMWRQTMNQMRVWPYQVVKQQVAEGTAEPSFTSALIEQNPNPSVSEEEAYIWVSSAFYTAGTDTTVSVISSFFLAMTLFPEVQQKAQAELDKVVGSSHLPTFSDRPQLPYIEGLLKEVYRWNPVGPLALPHKLTQDDIYNGYHIPAGAIVFANSWGIMHDPTNYPSPFEFSPERYTLPMRKDGPNPDPCAFAFGYGRRICPGQYIADANLFIIIAMTLAVFNISKAADEDGKVTEPTVEYTSSIVSHPLPFKCSITVRSPEANKLIYPDDASS